MKVALLVPVYRGAHLLPALLESVATQTCRPDEIWIAETGPGAEARAEAERHGARYHSVDADAYDHAGTRSQLARATDADAVILLSQDARPRHPAAFERLLRPLAEDHAVAGAYGRQVPPRGAHPFVGLKRRFLYPERSRVKRRSDAAELGFRTAFFSNAFGAWRRSALAELGYFGERRLMAEDVATAAAALLRGLAIAYVADAEAEHANELGLGDELRRYFDIGAVHAQEPWVQAAFGGPGRDGLRFLRAGIADLRQQGRADLVPLFCLWSLLKRGAYGLGRGHRFLPPALCARLSGFPLWWRRPTR